MHTRILLCGNPNCGKTTLFNRLTGSHAHVGNWPGITVERREGVVHLGSAAYPLLDLPGVYALSDAVQEERVARDAILEAPPALILNVVDATNLERNLLLTTQLIALGRPLVVALNMMDEAARTGLSIDVDALAQGLGVPVIPISAAKGEGMTALQGCMRTILHLPFAPRALLPPHAEAAQRYAYLSKLLRRCVDRPHAKALSRSDKIDRIVTHPFWAMPIFILLMLASFQLSVGGLAAWLRRPLEYFFGSLMPALTDRFLAQHGASGFVRGLAAQGVWGGISAVLTLLPSVALLFLCLSLLEDSGYMARAAYILDRSMRRFGLTGKAFLPLLTGFGCTVPAVMAARSMEDERTRRLGIAMLPFLSCSARIPVYAAFTGAFFSSGAVWVVSLLYGLGIAVALFTASLLHRGVLPGQTPPLLLELPPYRLPAARNVWRTVWQKSRAFIVRAGLILMQMTIVIYLLQSFTPRLQPAHDPKSSLLGLMGQAVAPLFALCGFGFWQAAVALIAGFLGKEAIIGTLGVLFGAQGGLSAALQAHFTPLSAFSFLVFVLLYTPCAAAVSTVHNELKSWRWTVYTLLYPSAAAWLLSALAYQLGKLAGL